MVNEKTFHEPDTSLFPVPAVMVSCASKDGKRSNIITLAWVGILSSDPPIIGIAIRPSRFSYGLISETGEFAVNLPSEDQTRAMDLCGRITGKDTDKFAEAGLTAIKANKIKAPLIKECPVNLECKVVKVLKDFSKSHHLFLGEVVAVAMNGDLKGKLDIGKIKPVAFCAGKYFGIGQLLGSIGFSRK